MSLESRVSVVEEAIIIMKDLPVSHDECLESYFNALKASGVSGKNRVRILTSNLTL